MSGFAVLVQPHVPVHVRSGAFEEFLQYVADFKRLDATATAAAETFFTAAKLDTRASLHRGITRDEQTGSWLFAAGTVVPVGYNGDTDPGLRALLSGYVARGAEALQPYDGSFALLIYNGQDQSVSVITDPAGQFAVYYAQRGEQIFIASSALAIARQIQAKPDRLMLETFLRAGRVHGEKTLWQEVRRLPPATVLKITHDSLTTTEYWTPQVDEAVARLSVDAALGHAAEMLVHIFERALTREGQVWADLTGGFDSRLTTLIMDKIGVPFSTYCAGPAGHPDVVLSRLVSQEMGWPYQHVALPEDWAQEQGAWAEIALGRGEGHLNAFQVAEVLWGHQQRAAISPVHVTGTCADEWREPPCWRTDLFSIGKSGVNLDYFIDSMVLSPIPASVLREDWTREVRAELVEHFSHLTAGYRGLPNTRQAQALFIRHRYPTHGGAYLSAASGIVRSLAPFCFKEPITFGFSLKYRWRLNYHYRFVRALMERENPRLARIPTTKGGPAVPMRLTNLPQFRPLWEPMLRRAVHKVMGKVLGNGTFPRPSSGGKRVRLARLDWATSKQLLEPAAMHSAALYDAGALRSLVEQARTPGFKSDVFLDRIVTLEMALHAVGARVTR